MLNILLALCGVTLLILAVVVVYSSYRSSTNKWLGGFLVSGFLWLLANLMANTSDSPSANLMYTRLALVGAALIPLTYLMFCLNFIKHKSRLNKRYKFLIFSPIVLILLATPTSFNIRSVTADGFEPGLAYLLLVAVVIIYFYLGTLYLVREYKRAKQLKRQQLYYILLGTGLTVVPGLLLNGVFPLIGYTDAVTYAPLFVIFFAVFTTIAIVKHKLFDIKLIIARSLGYAASLIVLATVYGTLVFTISSLLFDLNIPIHVQVFISAATGVAALTFQTLQRKFDKITNRLFYRDAYDTQNFLDEFNKVLVTNYHLDALLKKSAEVIEKNLKPTFCVFGIKETTTVSRRIIGTHGHPNFNEKEISFVRSRTPHLHQKTIIVDSMESKDEDLQHVLQSREIAILGRLTQSVSRVEEGVGYIILGAKKSGNPYGSKDEKVIEIIINELVIAIQNSLRTEEIEAFNLTLQEKVNEATRKIRRTNEKLKQMDETKDDFISMASHQLRTPLTSVKGYISMVLEEDAGKITPMQREMLGQAFFSSQRMVYLIADLLNVSRLKTGKFVMDRSPIKLDQIVEQELRQLKETAASRSLTLDFETPKDFPTLMLDETKTRQIIMNFVDNAIYYTPAGGHIKVRLINKPHSVELRVEDDGIGVPKNEQPHLFTKFYRAGNARQARPDGTGLGLFMAKKVIVAQGGALIFESEEGKGSTFGFIFSKSAAGSDASTPPVLEVALAEEPELATKS